MIRPKMDYMAKFAAVSHMSHNLISYIEYFCCLAVTCPYDKETLKSLFSIWLIYHHPVDLPDTIRLD